MSDKKEEEDVETFAFKLALEIFEESEHRKPDLVSIKDSTGVSAIQLGILGTIKRAYKIPFSYMEDLNGVR